MATKIPVKKAAKKVVEKVAAPVAKKVVEKKLKILDQKKVVEVKFKKIRAVDVLPQVGAEHLCDRVANGEFYHAIANDYGISQGALSYWLECNAPNEYAHARELRAEHIVEELIGIADEEPGYTNQGGTDTGAVQHAKLRIDTRKWLASKMLPRKYGDRISVDLPPGYNSPEAQQDLSVLTNDELKALMAIRAKLAKKPNEA